MTDTKASTRFYLSAISPTGEIWRNVSYATKRERSTAAVNLRIAGWLRITLHDEPGRSLTMVGA